MSKADNGGLKRIIRAAEFSWKGFRAAFQNEAAFRQELALTLLIVPLAFRFGATALETAVLIGVWLIVPIVELLNSAIEAVVDRIGDEYHPLAGRAKDVGSAAVFLALCNAGIVWLLILFM